MSITITKQGEQTKIRKTNPFGSTEWVLSKEETDQIREYFRGIEAAKCKHLNIRRQGVQVMCNDCGEIWFT